MSNSNICKSLEEYSEKIQNNIETDRAQASVMVTDLMLQFKKDPGKYREIGLVAAKFMEVLQRSNEQLVKLASLVQGKNSVSQNSALSSDEKEDIFDYFQEKEKTLVEKQ